MSTHIYTSTYVNFTRSALGGRYFTYSIFLTSWELHGDASFETQNLFYYLDTVNKLLSLIKEPPVISREHTRSETGFFRRRLAGGEGRQAQKNEKKSTFEELDTEVNYFCFSIISFFFTNF